MRETTTKPREVAWFPLGTGDCTKADTLEWGAVGADIRYRIIRVGTKPAPLYQLQENARTAWVPVGGHPFETIADAKRRADQLLNA